MRQEGSELTRNSKAHMLTMPMHTADDSLKKNLNASKPSNQSKGLGGNITSLS